MAQRDKHVSADNKHILPVHMQKQPRTSCRPYQESAGTTTEGPSKFTGTNEKTQASGLRQKQPRRFLAV